MAESEKITKADYTSVAEFIWNEYSGRKSRRGGIEAVWASIDRQLRLEPVRNNLDRNGQPMVGTEWKPFVEQPWQSEAHEILVNDASRLLFPDDNKYFNAVPDDSEEVLFAVMEAVAEYKGIAGEANQEMLSFIIEGLHTTTHALYPHRGQWERMLADAIAYGAYAGRYQLVTMERFTGDHRGTYATKTQFPALVHYPIKNVYVDDAPPSVWHTSYHVGPSTIFVYNRKLLDLQMCIKKQGADEGWIASQAKELAAGKDEDGNCNVTLVEFEGDLIVRRSRGGDLFLPNSIATIACVGDEPGAGVLVRYKANRFPFHTWVTGTYFPQPCASGGRVLPYSTSPLIKGEPLQRGGSLMFNLAMHSGCLNVEPPISFPSDDPNFAITNGPEVMPRAKWPTIGEVKTHQIGEVDKLSAVYQTLKAEYQDVVGTQPARLGAQTKSHTTAYAIDTEISRGESRTVEFVRRFRETAMRTALHIEYDMLREIVAGGPVVVFVRELRQWLPVTAAMLPEKVFYEVNGAAQPQEEERERQRKGEAIAAAMKLLEIEMAVSKAEGRPPVLPNLPELMRVVLQSGFPDADKLLPSASPAGVPSIVAPEPVISGVDPMLASVAPEGAPIV